MLAYGINWTNLVTRIGNFFSLKAYLILLMDKIFLVHISNGSLALKYFYLHDSD